MYSQPEYSIGYCFDTKVKIPLNELRKGTDHIWTIEKYDVTKLKFFCDGIKIADIETQSSDKANCKTMWLFDCAKIRFSDYDTASDFYREYTKGRYFIYTCRPDIQFCVS